jgi:hypothetical protein
MSSVRGEGFVEIEATSDTSSTFDEISQTESCDGLSPGLISSGTWTAGKFCSSNIRDADISDPRNCKLSISDSNAEKRCGICYSPLSRKRTRDALCYAFTASKCTLRDVPVNDGKTRLRSSCFVGDSLLGQLVSQAVVEGYASADSAPFFKSFMLTTISDVSKSCGVSGSLLGKKFSAPQHCPSEACDYHRKLSNLLWTRFISRQRCDTLIIGTGMHLWKEKSAGGLQSAYQRIAASILEYLEANWLQPGRRVYFVASPPGYRGCDTAAVGPVIAVHEAALGATKSVPSDHFYWATIDQLQHDTWPALFNASRFRGQLHYIDATRILAARGDAHPRGDCLHFCVSPPGVRAGPLHTWLQILLNAIGPSPP